MLKKLKRRQNTHAPRRICFFVVFLDSFLVLVRCPGLGKRNGKRPPLLPGGTRNQDTRNRKQETPGFLFFLGGGRNGKWPSRDLGPTSFVCSLGWLAGWQPAFTWMEEGYLEYLGCVFQLAWPCAFRPSPVPLFPRIPVPQDSRTPGLLHRTLWKSLN